MTDLSPIELPVSMSQPALTTGCEIADPVDGRLSVQTRTTELGPDLAATLNHVFYLCSVLADCRM